MGQASKRILLTIAVALGLSGTGAIFATTGASAQTAITPASVHVATDSDDDDDDDDDGGAPRGGVDTGVGGASRDDDDDDDGGAPRGGVDTGMGGTAGSGDAEGGSVPVVPLSLAGAGLLAVGAYWVRRAFFAGA
ncbi:hypothetical protein [Nonomuraea sp. SYSU D8015]|uniref:hypothetical protein n=1 Tax=Nonomuraea sp. SYSU D8015 TaxID=2593644 RepID=UPI001660A329|nr:hypothetical protein [Nonomuraea sp. SYSU D8015]